MAISAIQIKDINNTDTLRSMIDKINQNFDAIVAHGGGPTGNKGDSVTGATGKRGNSLFVAREPVDSEITNGTLNPYPNEVNPVQNKAVLIEDDKILSNEGVLYNYTAGKCEEIINFVTLTTNAAASILDSKNYWTRLGLDKSNDLQYDVIRLKDFSRTPNEINAPVKKVLLGEDRTSNSTEKEDYIDKIAKITSRMGSLNLVENNKLVLMNKESDGLNEWVLVNTNKNDSSKCEDSVLAIYNNNKDDGNKKPDAISAIYNLDAMSETADKIEKDKSDELYQGIFINPGADDGNKSNSYAYFIGGYGYLSITRDFTRIKHTAKNAKHGVFLDAKNVMSENPFCYNKQSEATAFVVVSDNAEARDKNLMKDFHYESNRLSVDIKNQCFDITINLRNTTGNGNAKGNLTTPKLITSPWGDDTVGGVLGNEYRNEYFVLKTEKVDFSVYGGPCEYEWHSYNLESDPCVADGVLRITVPEGTSPCVVLNTANLRNGFEISSYTDLDDGHRSEDKNIPSYYPFFKLRIRGSVNSSTDKLLH